MDVINALGRRKASVARVYLKAGSGSIIVNGKQAEAIRLGISRALVKISEDNKPPLKAKKYLTRDARVVERKKYGKPKARKSFQFSKR